MSSLSEICCFFRTFTCNALTQVPLMGEPTTHNESYKNVKWSRIPNVLVTDKLTDNWMGQTDKNAFLPWHTVHILTGEWNYSKYFLNAFHKHKVLYSCSPLLQAFVQLWSKVSRKIWHHIWFHVLILDRISYLIDYNEHKIQHNLWHQHCFKHCSSFHSTLTANLQLLLAEYRAVLWSTRTHKTELLRITGSSENISSWVQWKRPRTEVLQTLLNCQTALLSTPSALFSL